MSGYAINTKYVEVPQLWQKSFLDKGDTGFFSIQSELTKLPIKVNNSFIFIRPEAEELVFTNEGKITQVLPPVLIQSNTPRSSSSVAKAPPKKLYKFTFKYNIDKSLINNHNKLNELKYSLRSIYNFHKPQAHFHQQFRELQKDDYKAIVNGWVYVLRTAFGKLSNSLPRQNKLEFLSQSIDRFKTIDTSKIPLLQGLHFLNEYINHRIMSRGRFLVATDRLIKNHLAEMLDENKVGFVDENTGNEKCISMQAAVFQKLFSLHETTNMFEYIHNSMQQNKNLEKHFEDVFKKQTWPIDLRV